MKIDNDGKPNYGPRKRGPKPSKDDGDWLFWVGVIILVLVLLAAM